MKALTEKTAVAMLAIFIGFVSTANAKNTSNACNVLYDSLLATQARVNTDIATTQGSVASNDQYVGIALANLADAKSHVDVAVDAATNGGAPGAPVLYSYAYGIEGELLQAALSMGLAKNQIMISDPYGNQRASSQYDEYARTLDKLNDAEAVAGHCYMNAYYP